MNKLFRAINIILIFILIIILIFSIIFIVKGAVNKEEISSIFGYTPLVVLSGSMETEIFPGDLIVVKKENTKLMKQGDVIAFYTDNTKKTIITHRIIEVVNENGKIKFTTKGDNNESNDKGYVEEDLVVGKYDNIRFKGVGNIVIFLQTPTGMCVAISIPLGILIICQYMQNRKDRKEIEALRKQKTQKRNNE